ncbi:MAG: hypothetical protein JWL62_2560 [Hyphomicrobiales bacterium]|nr:hypothetical protein [Hyphomicrobiales bacterium]
MTNPTGMFPNLRPHPERVAILGEVHARPFHALATPARLIHYAFMTSSEEAQADRASLAQFCRDNGLPVLSEDARQARMTLGAETLRWEQHSEFTTYTVEFAGNPDVPFAPPAGALASAFAVLPAPGRHLASADLHLLKPSQEPDLSALFDTTSLAASRVMGGRALIAADFQTVDGFVRILVLDRGLDAASAGALAVRLLEIETYRLLALLGLPEAQRLSPSVGEAEATLAAISNAMAAAGGLESDNVLLERLTALAARSEAEATSAAFRFGASRAYDGIVQQRLVAIGEEPIGPMPTIAAFLSRRMHPAIRTCQMLQDRQGDLSQKLARAANLLRTRVDVEIERQNRDLLRSMNVRARLQLRLQQTVEGLSIAAISYYVVGLAGYILKAAKEVGYLPIDPTVATALFVPVAVLVIALVLHRIRRAHTD